MTDLPPLPPCPFEKRGRHHLMVIVPESDDNDLTLICEACCAIRRIPVTGRLVGETLDGLTADDIEKAMRG